MKTAAVVIVSCAAAASAVADFTAWQWEQDINVGRTGLHRLELPPATVGAVLPSLADIRLVSPSGVESPWLLEEIKGLTTGPVAVGDFKATLVGRGTVLTGRQQAGEIEAITLTSPAEVFLKSARVEGSTDGSRFEILAAGEVVFRDKGGASRMNVPLPRGDWRHLRVTIDDERSEPVPFTAMGVTPVSAKPETLIHKLTIRDREERDGWTYLTVVPGARNLYLAEVELDIPSGLFSRRGRIEWKQQTEGAAGGSRVAGEAILYRIDGGSAESVSSLVIPVRRRIPADELLVIIENGDSPPLAIRGVSASRHPDRLLFHAEETGTWKLLTGNRHASMPRYDLAPLAKSLQDTPPVATLVPSAPAARPGYRPAPVLPAVETSGGTIDPAEWAHKRVVNAKLPGVIRIELDAATLSRVARGDFGDLRLIQNGRQVPWLTEGMPLPQVRSVIPRVEEDPDPKRPTVSRWKIVSPEPGLVIHNVELESSDPLFTRDFEILHHGRDSFGNPSTRVLARQRWVRTPADPSPGTVRIALGNTRVEDPLWIETDNRDNAPVRIAAVRLLYIAPAIVAKVTATGPLELYYGNPRATPPAYDLALVRDELMKADKQTATLGPEIALKSEKRRTGRELGTGSPWLWSSLAVVIAGLLVIIARLLPKPANL